MVILSSELELQKNEIDEETSDSEETGTCVGASVSSPSSEFEPFNFCLLKI